MSLLNATMSSVLLPAFSELQNDPQEMRTLAQKTIKITSFLLVPLLTVLFITARPLVLILFSDAWEPCVIFLQLSCFVVLLYPFHALNLQIITACGRSDVFLILEIIKKIQVIIVIFATYRYGVLAMVYGMIISSPIAFIENSYYNGKLIQYHWYQQIRDLLPVIIAGVLAGLAGWYIITLFSGNWAKLIFGAMTAGIAYLLITIVCKLFPQELYQVLKNKAPAWAKIK